MSPEQKWRISQAIVQCDDFIDQEEQRDPELRPAAAKDLLDFYRQHKVKLQSMLNS